MTSPASRAGTRRARLTALDVTRSAAILGMIAVHVGGDLINRTTGLWHLLGQASGYAAGLFAVVAGVGISIGLPARFEDQQQERRAVVAMLLRGAVLFVLGLLVEPLSGGVLTILCVYGALFPLAVLARRLPAAGLAALGGLLLVAWPVVSLLIRRDLGPHGPLEVKIDDLFTDPGGVLRTLFLDGMYPVPTWLSLVLIAWAAHRAGWLQPGRTRELAWAATTLGLLGFAGSRIAQALFQPQPAVLADLLRLGYSPRYAQLELWHSYGVPASQIWQALLIPARHSGTPFELLRILAVAAAIYLAATWLLRTPSAPAIVWLGMPGRIALTLYVTHLLLLISFDWAWLDAGNPAVAATAVVVVLWTLAFALGWWLRNERGPIESLVHTVSRPWQWSRPTPA